MKNPFEKLTQFLGLDQRPEVQGSTLAPNPQGRTLETRATMTTGTVCPYCNSTDFVKRGIRKKKHEAVQLYLCRNAQCGRTFTAERVKGKRFPLAVILEGISYYNLGLSLEQTCELLGKKFPDVAAPTPATLASWVEEYKPICRFERMRPYAIKLQLPARPRLARKSDVRLQQDDYLLGTY
ncbi:MAG: hypothetical protein Q7R90_00635 [bacterium]|nr:hypothetical protein [bacterium]